MTRLAILAASCAATFAAVAADNLASGFADPPHEAKPQTWWHWMNGNITKEGITADLEAMKDIGLGGAQIFDIDYGIPRGNVDFASPEWFDCAKHAAKEAKRLGLDLALNTGSGWSCAGGPWNVISNGMKFVTYSEKTVTGPARFEGRLPPLPFEGNYPSRYGNYSRDVAVIAYPTPAEGSATPSTNHWQEIFRARHQRAAQFQDRFTKRKVAGGLVDPAREIDLTGKRSADGTLTWDVPEGNWTILRIGYCANGRINYPPSACGRGLECDKLSAKALDAHWAGFLDKLFAHFGPDLVGRRNGGVTGIIVDSYEAGSQNWTDGFEMEFERRVGYSIKSFLPVFAGRVVGSQEKTERFLEDFRRAVSSAFIDNFGYATRRKAHERDLELYVEPYGDDMPAHDVEYAHCADVPMTEFWTGRAWPWRGDPSPAVSESRVWGSKIVAAESYTTWPKDDRWTLNPRVIKRQTDYQYCEGINRMIYHTYAHQPWMDPKLWPGMTMGRFGIMFNRNVTWWKMGKEWIRYQTRCQYMLQQGKTVVDAFYFAGEDAPCLSRGMGRKAFGQGSDYAVISREALMASTAKDRRIVSPGGATARMLILPEYITSASPDVMRKIESFATAGVTVIGELPQRSFGLRGCPEADDEVRRISERMKSYGNVVHGMPIAEAVRKSGHVPDFIGPKQPVCLHIHRTADDGSEIYFVSAQNDTNVVVDCRFRVKGRVPEIWNPMSGKIELPKSWREEDAMTRVTLDFDPDGSRFVVFRPQPTAGVAVQDVLERQSAMTVAGPWELSFPAGSGAPATVMLDKLVSWTERPEEEIRYFSGTATYRKTLQPVAKKAGERVVLDLGDVRELCEVTVNGKTFPVLWKKPYSVDITDAIGDGAVDICIRVANVGANRLIGDERKPDDCTWTDKSWSGPHLTCWPDWMTNIQSRASGRRTFTTWHHWTKDDEPLPSGLLGPVTLTFEKAVKTVSEDSARKGQLVLAARGRPPLCAIEAIGIRFLVD